MEDNVIIRNAQLSDLDKIVRLFDAYRLFYGKKSELRKTKIFISERLKFKESEIFVAEIPVYGIVAFTQLYPLFSSTRLKKLWLLNDLFVSPAFRGRGISTLLIQRAQILAKDTQAAGIMLETEKSNIVGNTLYQKTGFNLNTDSNFYEWKCEEQ